MSLGAINIFLDGVDGTMVSPCFIPWLEEVAELSEYGMPSASFSLVLGDEDPLMELNIQAWEVLKQDFAWTRALRERKRQGLTRSAFTRGPFEGFEPKLLLEIEKIHEGSSFVRCNFPLGELTYDPQEVLKENEMLSDHEEWNDEWEDKRRQTRFHTEIYSPLNRRDQLEDPSESLTSYYRLNFDTDEENL